MKYSLLSLLVAAAILPLTLTRTSRADVDPSAVLSENTTVAQQALANLREAGPDGLHALLHLYDNSPDPRLLPAIDAVAGQKDALFSRLYWYTDVDKASAAAKAAHKPILYLRLLGKLTDEYSCANSRFFRTVLYANVQVSNFLRERYILVWVSERPVPVVTIDYGDGRVLKRTITGNSIHYVVTPRGEVIDALPGLYDPKTFITILNNAERLGSTREAIAEPAVKYFRETEQELWKAWQADARQANPALLVTQVQEAAKAPEAVVAMRRTASKARVETPLLAKISPPVIAAAMERSIGTADESAWQKIAALHAADATLDFSSRALIHSQMSQDYCSVIKLNQIVERFQQNIALDTVRNNYQFRRRILSWLGESKGNMMIEDLNRRVYAELFLTPRSDPWLGLMPEGTYSALRYDGCVLEANPLSAK